MSGAMKKLKLLQHLTASASVPPPQPSTTTTSATQHQQHQYQFPTPPASAVSPQTSPIRHHYNPTHLQAHNHYTDVFRSARAALHHLHASHPSQSLLPSQTAAAAEAPSNTPLPHHLSQQQCVLPGGFMVLTPASTHDVPALCVPASPPPPAVPMLHAPIAPRGGHQSFQPSSSSRPLPSRRRSPPRRQQLTRDAVAKIGKDSRLARWERVLGYVREQRVLSLAGTTAAAATAASSPPLKPLDRKRRAEEIARIEARNRELDILDRYEQDLRSLWSGASGGTNGVDEFVWSEDEDDDILPMPQAPPPQKVLPVDEEGMMFECEMQVDDGVGEGRKRSRPRSTPDDMVSWGKWVVADMPVICREGRLEGLGRLAGRRLSAY